jgi:hypothetical protein
MRKSAIHILLSVVLLVLLVSGYYYYTGMPWEKGSWITLLSFPLFIICIYTGRGLCSRWFGKNKRIWYLLYFVPCFAAAIVTHYLLARFLLQLPGLGFAELSIGYGPLFVLGLVVGFLVKIIRE